MTIHQPAAQGSVVFDASLCRVEVEATTPAEAIRTALTLGMAEGLVEPPYVQAAIERESRFPTGLPTQPVGIAVPHASPNGWVLRPAVMAVRLAHPVEFVQMATIDQLVPVELVLALALPEKDQVGMLSALLALAQDAVRMRRILTADTAGMAAIITAALQDAGVVVEAVEGR